MLLFFCFLSFALICAAESGIHFFESTVGSFQRWKPRLLHTVSEGFVGSGVFFFQTLQRFHKIIEILTVNIIIAGYLKKKIKQNYLY